MAKINETVRTFNSLMRTFLFAILLAGAGLVGWKGYSLYYQPQKLLAERQSDLDAIRALLVDRDEQLALLSQDLAETVEQLERTETSLRLLKMKHRIAHLRVLDQQSLDDSDRVVSTIEFYEVTDEGLPVSKRRKTFHIEGDRVYVECLVVKFEDKYIEQADLERSTAICLFHRIFGEFQQPQEGYPLDTLGSSPAADGRRGKMSQFERQIWRGFWNFANDPAQAAELGIRAAHADAPSTRVEKDAVYELELRSTGEFTIRRLPHDPGTTQPAA